MSHPIFLLQIVDAQPPHDVVRLPGGGALEADLIEVCAAAIVKRGVGMFRTEAHVRQAVTEGMTEAIRGLKAQTRDVLL